MENTTNPTMETEQASLGSAERASADQPGKWQASDSFLEGWDDTEANTAADQPEVQTEENSMQDGAENPASDDTAGNEQQTTEQGSENTGADGNPQQGEGSETTQAQQPPADAPKTWTLNHLGESRTVGEADMVVLAQKGLDYDRIRTKYDESRPVMELFNQFARKAGMTVPDYVAYIRTQAKKATGMSEADAKRTVELEDREAAVAAKEDAEAQRRNAANQAAAAQQSADARRRADVLEFQKIFPDVARDPKSIPQEVWAEVRGGTTLTAAYTRYALAQAKAAQQAAEHKAEAAAQNQKNAARTTGSMKSAGNSAGKDPFLEGWES